MNLVDIKEKLTEKNANRSRLIGKKEILIEQLSKVGYKTVKDGLTAIAENKKKVKELKETYDKKLESFEKKYLHLLTE